jgi:hypothetical protein
MSPYSQDYFASSNICTQISQTYMQFIAYLTTGERNSVKIRKVVKIAILLASGR